MKTMFVLWNLLTLGASLLLPSPLEMALKIPSWVNECLEQQSSSKNDFRTPVLAAIREGDTTPACANPPDEAVVLRALPRVSPGIPGLYEESRDDVQIVTERLINKVDEPRFFPLVGPARLHHLYWKCTVYYTEVVQSAYPFPFESKRPRVEVVYIDTDHLHLHTVTQAQSQSKCH
jgi:hypothetical protein